MASLHKTSLVFLLLFLFSASLLHLNSAARRLSEHQEDNHLFRYHNGPLLLGNISINLIWYGKFKPSQRSVVSDFILSLSAPSRTSAGQPSVVTWMGMIKKYYRLAGFPSKQSSGRLSVLTLSLAANQILDEGYSLGKSLDDQQIKELASKGGQADAINVVLTSSDVAVRGFCSSRCGTHGSSMGSPPSDARRLRGNKLAYIWVGNSETQCPGQCAWPFHQPIYGPQGPPLVAPNNDSHHQDKSNDAFYPYCNTSSYSSNFLATKSLSHQPR
ncbi:hypothetical protein SAY87_020597 [Trapa incisa]|uniref:Uncharacterized protein n=1 Tax=Trapa incisa TaxID=236973 RepID=A0AAN7JQ31_9MYRT|nr:hypothetical protein SAY87_020597 [Trapa incisa]